MNSGAEEHQLLAGKVVMVIRPGHEGYSLQKSEISENDKLNAPPSSPCSQTHDFPRSKTSMSILARVSHLT